MGHLRLQYAYWMIVFVGMITETQATGKFIIQLVNYKNPDHKLYNGECCDSINWCINHCDNFFRFCAVTLGSTEQCSLGGLLSTKVFNDDSFTFGSDLGGGLKNPIAYSFHEWKGVSLSVEVWDDDSGQVAGSKLDDLVDKYTLVVTDTPAKNKASSSAKDKKLCGKSSCANIKTQVYCDDNYLIPQCNEYCVPRDNDVEGHYTCDYDRGLKVCLDGWYDASSNCTKKKKECTPRNDTAGHYDCNPESGEQVCHTGWMGTNCTQVFVPSSLRTPITQTAHAPKTTIAITNTAGLPTDTATSKTLVKTSSMNVQSTTTTKITETIKTLNSQRIKTTEQVHATATPTTTALVTTTTTTTAAAVLTTLIATKTEGSKVSLSSKVIQPSSTEVKGSKTLILPSSTTAKLVAKSSIVNRYETMTTMVMPTSVLRTSSAHASTTSPTMIGPTTGGSHVVHIDVSPSKNWTKEKENKIKDIIADKLNEFCKKQPQSCNINPNSTNNSTSLFNKTDVIIDTVNGSTGGGVLVSVKVKIPTTIPGISGGILVPSIVVKKVITSNTEHIEKETGLKVAVSIAPTTTMTTTTSKPLTTDPSINVKSTPKGSIIPGLTDYWAVIVCAVAATLLLLVITLCFTYHANRSNKIHPLPSKAVTKTKVTSFSHKDKQELIALTRVQHIPPNKSVVKVQAKDKGLRSRSSSINKDKHSPSPFTPDYIDF